MDEETIINGLSDGDERFSAVIPAQMFTGVPIEDRDRWLADAFQLAKNIFPDTHRKHGGPCGAKLWRWGFVTYYEAKGDDLQYVYIQSATQSDKE